MSKVLAAIPQVEDDDLRGDERVAWSSFVHFTEKVHDGSEKVTWTVRYAVRAFAERVTEPSAWEDRPLEALFATVAKAMPPVPPFASGQALVMALRDGGHLDAAAGEEPAHHEARRARVVAAAEACIGAWSGGDFVARADRVMWNSQYDRTDALVVILYILAAWPMLARA